MEFSPDPQTQRLFLQAASHVFGMLKEPAKASGVKVLANLKGYEGYLRETNRKVSTFRTFANPSETVRVLDHFVAPRFTPASTKLPILDMDEILEGIIQGSKTVISGFAGYGKSMAMRFIALSLFENPRGRIPIFLELRNLNRLESPNLIAYINSTYGQGSSVSIEAFRQNLESGVFALLFDGFDELNHDIRREVEAQILDLAIKYPKNSVTVSGRPNDARYNSWRDFELLKMCPMSKTQIVELVSKLNYDAGVKKRFIKKVNEELFETHESFMSTPLLAILMLLTYEKNSNIPDKMYLFYGKAFETLFNQHDATKDQYDRARKCDLQIDQFQKVFSTFCLATYVVELTEFTQVEIMRNLRDALEYSSVPSKPAEYLEDLEEAVCLIMKEGQSYFFVHRSFQEYFAAVFLSNCPEEDRDKFLDGVANRGWDEVLPMLHDMAADQIEATWLPRKLAEYFDAVGEGAGKMDPLSALWGGIAFDKRGERVHISHLPAGPFRQPTSVIQRFYPGVDPSISIHFAILHEFLGENWDDLPFLTERKYSYGEGIEVIERTFSFDAFPSELLEKSRIIQFANQGHRNLKKLQSNLLKLRRQKENFLDRLLIEGGDLPALS